MKTTSRQPATQNPMSKQLEWLKGVMVVCLLAAGLWGHADESKTPKYVPLDEILRKWKAVSLDEAAAAAEQGDLTAQHFLGYYHFEGLGGKFNLAEGLRWYRRAAEAGFPNALNNLGAAYLQGRGVARDEVKALDYFRQAGARGSWPSLHTVARMVALDSNGAEESENIRRQLEKAARAGDSEAQIQLAFFVLNPPRGGMIEHANALYLFRKAAEQGRADAMTAIANVYMEQRAVQNYDQAHQWHQQAAEKGQPASEVALGWMYFHGFGVKADRKQAFEWTQKAADRNYSGAFVNMGRYLSGDDLPRLPDEFQPDYAQAAHWYTKGVQLGDARAHYYLGKLIWQQHLPGRARSEARPLVLAAAEARLNPARKLLFEIDLDDPERAGAAIATLERLAQAGEPSAMVLLAKEYRLGKNVPTDHHRAVKLYLTARHSGESEAFQALAMLDSGDQAGSKSADQHAQFSAVLSQMVRALKQKDATFHRELGRKYLQGDSVPKSVVEACIWLRLSAHEGNTEAQSEADAILVELKENQQLAVKSWLTGLIHIQEALLESN